jgi:hypothetical protein
MVAFFWGGGGFFGFVKFCIDMLLHVVPNMQIAICQSKVPHIQVVVAVNST